MPFLDCLKANVLQIVSQWLNEKGRGLKWQKVGMAYFALAVANKGNDSKFFFLVLTAIPSHEKSSIRYFRKVGRNYFGDLYVYIYIYIFYINYFIHCKLKIDNPEVPKIVRVPGSKKNILRRKTIKSWQIKKTKINKQLLQYIQNLLILKRKSEEIMSDEHPHFGII